MPEISGDLSVLQFKEMWDKTIAIYPELKGQLLGLTNWTSYKINWNDGVVSKGPSTLKRKHSINVASLQHVIDYLRNQLTENDFN